MISNIVDIMLYQLVFLVLFEVAFKRSTHFQWNRFYLLGTLIISLGLPFFSLDNWFSIFGSAAPVSDWFPRVQSLDGLILRGSTTSEYSLPLVQGVWVFGIGVHLLWMLRKLYQLFGLIRSSESCEHLPGFRLIEVSNSASAFSFFSWVFIGDQHEQSSRELILRHEAVHVQRKHSLDLLLLEAVRIIFWFNPLMLWYRKRLVEIHEFQADSEVILGHEKDYYLKLLAQAFQCPSNLFIHSFYKNSLIKKRIVMLRKNRSAKKSLFLFAWVLPVVFGMLFYSSCKEELPQTISEEVTSAVPAVTDAGSEELISFKEIEQVPVYPGCEGADDKRSCFNEKVMRHIMKNFNYPQEAQNGGIQGMVAVMFTIDDQGMVSEIKIKGPDPILEAEARRIIQRLPQMQAGSHAGKNSSVTYSIPITFKLD